MDRNGLADALREIAEETWNSSSQPALLSSLPVELQRRRPGEDYKEALGTQSFKIFITETGPASGYQLIEHPQQRAKLGLLPAGETFQFPLSADSKAAGAASSNRTIPGGARAREVIAVLRLLSTLPDGDLDKITIPVSVIAKLFRE